MSYFLHELNSLKGPEVSIFPVFVDVMIFPSLINIWCFMFCNVSGKMASAHFQAVVFMMKHVAIQ